MRISDWSSDVCSSDLDHASIPRGFQKASRERIAIGEMLASRATEPRKEIAPHALQRPERLADRAMPMLQPVRVRGAHLHAVEQSHLRDWRPQQGKVGAQFFSVIIRSQQAAPGLPAWRVRRVIGYRSEEHTSDLQSL